MSRLNEPPLLNVLHLPRLARYAGVADSAPHREEGGGGDYDYPAPPGARAYVCCGGICVRTCENVCVGSSGWVALLALNPVWLRCAEEPVDNGQGYGGQGYDDYRDEGCPYEDLPYESAGGGIQLNSVRTLPTVSRPRGLGYCGYRSRYLAALCSSPFFWTWLADLAGTLHHCDGLYN